MSPCNSTGHACSVFRIGVPETSLQRNFWAQKDLLCDILSKITISPSFLQLKQGHNNTESALSFCGWSEVTDASRLGFEVKRNLITTRYGSHLCWICADWVSHFSHFIALRSFLNSSDMLIHRSCSFARSLSIFPLSYSPASLWHKPLPFPCHPLFPSLVLIFIFT